MGDRITLNVREGFSFVADSFDEPNHSYLIVSKSTGKVGASSQKKNASSLKKITKYVKKINRDATIAQDQKISMVHSFEQITNTIAAKSKLIHKIFIIPMMIKNYRIKQARCEIQRFTYDLNYSLSEPKPSMTPDHAFEPQLERERIETLCPEHVVSTWEDVLKKFARFNTAIMFYDHASKIAFKIPGGEIAKHRIQPGQSLEQLLSNEHLFGVLKDLNKVVSGPSKAAILKKINSQKGQFFVWESSPGNYAMVSRRSKHAPCKVEDIVQLDPSTNLFEQIAQVMDHTSRRESDIARLTKQGVYVADKQTADVQLSTSGKIGDYLFFGPEENLSISVKISQKKIVTRSAHSTDPNIHQLLRFFKEKIFTEQALALEMLQRRDADGYVCITQPDTSYHLYPKIPGLLSAKNFDPIRCQAENLFIKVEELLHLTNTQVVAYLNAADSIVTSQKEAEEKLLASPLGSYFVWKEGDLFYILQKIENNSPFGFATFTVDSEEESLLAKLEAIASQEAMERWRDNPKEKNHRVENYEEAVKLMMNAPAGSYCFWEQTTAQYGHEYGVAFKKPDQQAFEFSGNYSKAAKDLWITLDKVSSRTFQLNTLKQKFCRDAAEALSKLAYSPVGEYVLWREACGNVRMLFKGSSPLKSAEAEIVLPTENLFERVQEMITKGNLAVKNAGNKKLIISQLKECKAHFVDHLISLQTVDKYDLKNATPKSFAEIFKIAFLSRSAAHPDLGGDEEQFKKIVQFIEDLVEELSGILGRDIPFSRAQFVSLDTEYAV
ncbi:MAG: hypothetical protein CK425_11655 [Parachlamydia sp.]|nr:MAG: hypothetical protein CK425_11655 [Parachlamydia sp.]